MNVNDVLNDLLTARKKTINDIALALDGPNWHHVYKQLVKIILTDYTSKKELAFRIMAASATAPKFYISPLLVVTVLNNGCSPDIQNMISAALDFALKFPSERLQAVRHLAVMMVEEDMIDDRMKGLLEKFIRTVVEK